MSSLGPNRLESKPDALLNLARKHWEIENRLHHTKDRSLGEDADRTRGGATNAARLRSLAIGLLEYIAGASIPQKQIRISANPNLAVALLRKTLPKRKTRL